MFNTLVVRKSTVKFQVPLPYLKKLVFLFFLLEDTCIMNLDESEDLHIQYACPSCLSSVAILDFLSGSINCLAISSFWKKISPNKIYTKSSFHLHTNVQITFKTTVMSSLIQLCKVTRSFLTFIVEQVRVQDV